MSGKTKKYEVNMIDIKLWMEHFTELLKETFGERIYFVGLNIIALKNGATVEFDTMSEKLFNWARKLIKI